ncbi:MAG: serine/threonine-protein kinase [candidate division Zixibacteria bacterium]
MTEKIGNYKLLKKIGAGGMAQVYLAVHQDVPNLKVVLKVLSDPRLVERFKQEADKLALLDGYGHICQIKHFFNHGDDIVIAMEYIDGVTLEDMIKERERLEPQQAIQIICGVLETLEFAHNKGIFHRDIKPGNIMIDRNGQVKIIDFGIAKGESDPNLTVAGSSCGTPTYMPPEQFNPTKDIDYAKADIYAVGTTLYFMLTGKLPFTGDNAFALRDAKLFNDPKQPRHIVNEISRELNTIVMKSISREPQDRYASVGQMREALEKLLTNAPVKDKIPVAQPQPQVSPITSSKKIMTKKKNNPVIISGISIIILAAITYFVFWSGDDSRSINPPGLVSPGNNDTLMTALPDFTWTPATGASTYRLEIGDDADFISSQNIPELTDNRYTPNIDMADGLYYWRVKSVDADGNQSEYSRARIFYIETIEDKIIENGYLRLSVNPSGDIYIDDELQARDQKSFTAELPEGPYTIKVENSRSRQKRFSEKIEIPANDTIVKSFAFTFPPQRPAKEYGEVRIGSKPIIGALVFIDGTPQERRTNNTFRMEVGRHIIKAVLVLNDRELEKTDTVFVEKGGSHKLIFDFEE